MEITADTVRRLFLYNPEMGTLTWRADRGRAKAGDVVGHIDKKGRRRTSLRPRGYYTSHLIWLYMTGKFPSGEVDHIDRNKLNERWGNLRDVTRSINLMNRKGWCAAGLKGVRTFKGSPRFYAYYSSKASGSVYLGSFPTAEEAHAAWLEEATRRHGVNASAA